MAKKDFKGNPAMSFISQESIDKVEGKPESTPSATGTAKAPEGYRINPLYIETKSKRVQVLIQPSLHKEAKAISEELGISLNEFINRAVHEATYNGSVRELIKKGIAEG